MRKTKYVQIDIEKKLLPQKKHLIIHDGRERKTQNKHIIKRYNSYCKTKTNKNTHIKRKHENLANIIILFFCTTLYNKTRIPTHSSFSNAEYVRYKKRIVILINIRIND